MPTLTIAPPRAEILCAQQFVYEIFSLRESIHNRKLLYRGHSKRCYRLKPMIGRPLMYAGKKDVLLNTTSEQELLHRFRRRAYPHFERAITAGEAIFIARHHGLPTRLLDWTANALFSLYFACHEHPDEDGRIWAMLRRRPEGYDIDAFDFARLKTEEEVFGYRVRDGNSSDDAIKIVYPFYNTPRLLAQDGAFTIHSHPQVSIEDYNSKVFKKTNLDIETLYCWCVPKKSKNNIIEGLSGLGITHRSVYPDLDGVARSLWETEILWSRTSTGDPPVA